MAGRDDARPACGRAVPRPLLHKSDFERLLAAPPRARSAHFALHHVGDGPSRPTRAVRGPEGGELSTGAAPVVTAPVDDCWLGSVVPKRHARRAVTRNLLKRQIRAAGAQGLPAGLWLLRLKAPFAAAEFPSAASTALRRAARAELDRLLGTLAPRP